MCRWILYVGWEDVDWLRVDDCFVINCIKFVGFMLDDFKLKLFLVWFGYIFDIELY